MLVVAGHYARKKRSYPHISAYYQQPTYPAPTYQAGYPAVQSYQPSYNPSPAYPSDPVPPPPEYYHHPTPPPKPIRFDDAPEPVYGIATRTRRSFSCEGLSERACTLLEKTGSLVNCGAARFR